MARNLRTGRLVKLRISYLVGKHDFWLSQYFPYESLKKQIIDAQEVRLVVSSWNFGFLLSDAIEVTGKKCCLIREVMGHPTEAVVG